MRRLRSEEGSTVVEFGLSATILFLGLFGTIAFCTAMYSYNFVANMAREASRYAMVRGTACQGFADCSIDQGGLQTYVRSFQYPGINSNNVTVTASWSGLKKPGTTVTVTVAYTYTLNIPFWPNTGRVLNLSSTSQKVISQ